MKKVISHSIKGLVASCSLLALTLSNISIAHERFMVPSHTVFSGNKVQYATIISSISNDIFHPDRPLGNNDKGIDAGDLKPLFSLLESNVLLPNGETDSSIQWQAFQRLSVADVPFSQSGTYRVSLVQKEVAMTTFKKANGAPGRVFGPKPVIPEGASNIVRRTTAARVETFITMNEPSLNTFQPIGKGLELTGKTHPNDLFAQEPAHFKLVYNGKAVPKNTQLKVIKAGTRHRNTRNEQIIKVNESGEFTFTPQQAGFYFLTAETALNIEQPANVDVKHDSLYVTLEVFPQ